MNAELGLGTYMYLEPYEILDGPNPVQVWQKARRLYTVIATMNLAC